MGTTTATAGDHPAIATTKSTTTMNRMTAALLLLLLGTATATLVTAAPPKTRTIEILSDPIVLKYGEVHNRYQEPLALPEDVVAQFANGTMAIVDYKLDVVYENGSRVPLTDIYQHHYIFTMGSEDTMKAYYKYMQDAPYGAKTDGLEGWVKGAKNPVDFAQEQKKNKAHNRKLMMSTMAMKAQLEEASKRANKTEMATLGSASGAEERGTSHKLPDGYAFLADQPEAITGLYHFINTRAPPSLPQEQLKEGETSKLLQCPCTPQRVIDEDNGTVDGWTPFPPFGTCSAQFFDMNNPSCRLDTYQGGWRCCEDGNYLLDTDKYDTANFPEDTVYAKWILTFIDEDASKMNLKKAHPNILDVTGSLDTRGNIEFDVPQCEDGTLPEDCIYEQTAVVYVSGGINGTEDSLVSIPYTVGHLHVGGIDLTLYDDATGELICKSEAIYGNGTEPANEKNYIVGMTPCVFDDPPVFKKNDKVRVVSRYNATEPHFGVMALFLGTLSDVVEEA